MNDRLRLALVLVAVLAAGRAAAFPAFARKYGMACSACHVAWPIFNQVGQSFRDNGYQFGLGKDPPERQRPEFFPIALRTTAAYQFTHLTDQPTDSGAKTIQTGQIQPMGVDILTGGTLAQDLSFLLVVSGFGPDGTAGVESAWARFDNIGGTGWLNLRVGKFELDQPVSAHRNVTLFTNYGVYGAHPFGSAVPFDMRENQLGLELDGHGPRSLTRYALSFTTANGGDGLGRGLWSTPVLYGHAQQAFDLSNPVLPWVRVGGLGAIGWWPTVFETLTGSDGTATNVPGTGRAQKRYARAGAEVAWMLGYPSTPLLFVATFIHHREEAGLASGTDPATGADLSVRTNSANGGFLEADWAPFANQSENAIPVLFFARYDVVRYASGPGDVDAGTVGTRYYVAIGPRAAAAIHLELHAERVKGFDPLAQTPSLDNADVHYRYAALGVDLDF